MKYFPVLVIILSLFIATTFAQNVKTEKDIFGNTIITDNKGKKISIRRDVLGHLEIEENGRRKATLKKDVFDAHIYEDTNGNKITYSKEFWADILKKHKGSEESVFLSLIDQYRDTKNYKKEFKVDIFGDKIIEDNKGNKTTVGKDIFGDKVVETNGKSVKISRDIFGYLQLEENGRRVAYLKKDVFNNHIFTDKNNNEITYSKEFWTDLLKDFRGNEERVFLWLIGEYKGTSNYKKEFKVDVFGDKIVEDNRGNKTTVGKDISGNPVINTQGKNIKICRDIFGYLQLEENNRKVAYLKKDIFDTWIFTDNNKNELKYSKEFWADILNDFRGNEEDIFFWLIDMSKGLNNYKEEYKVDIFGDLQFYNNQREKASLKKNVFNEMVYEDSKGNKLTYSKDIWNKMKGRKNSDKKVFMDFIQKYLFH